MLAVVASSVALRASDLPNVPAPYQRLRDATLSYHGPSEDIPNLTEIRIGWFGPSDAADPIHGDFWWAANLAVEEANRSSATREPKEFAALPIRLVPRWAPDPWRAGVSSLARMVFDEQPLAVLGSVDSASTHLAEQIVAKVNLPLVSPVATDKTATLAGVSWMFSCAPDDTALARTLVDGLLAESSGTASYPASAATLRAVSAVDAAPARLDRPNPSNRAGEKSSIVLLATTDHESRMTAREVVRELSRRGVLPEFRFDLAPGIGDATDPLRSAARSTVSAVVIIADAADSARFTRMVRAELGSVPVFGGASMGRTQFREQAGPDAEGVHFPLIFDARTSDPDRARFMARFTAERHHAPDYAAALAYDATRLVIEAIRRAGPNRSRVRDALVQASPWSGITGTITFDGTGQNHRAALPLACIRHGTIVAAASSPVPSPTVSRLSSP